MIRAVFGIAIVVASVLLPIPGIASDKDQITIAIPTLSGTEPVGHSISVFLRLQVSRSFRQKEKARPGANLHRGAAYFVADPLARSTHVDAERLARQSGAQLVLWGTTVPIGKGAAAQLYLTIAEPYLDFRTTENEIWSVHASGQVLQLAFPRRRIAFAPVALSEELIRWYSAANYPRFCKTKTQEHCVVGKANDVYVRRGEEGEYSRVRYNHESWWLYTPFIGRIESQAVLFSSAIVAYFRSDWNLVLDLMGRVLKNTAGTELQIDARLFRGMAQYRLGQSGAEEMRQAYELNRFSARAIQFRAMGLIQDAASANSNTDRQKFANEAIRLLEGSRTIFDENDTWVQTAINVSNRLRRSHE